MDMENYIFKVIVPEETIHQIKNSRVKDIKGKTFPGYVLVEMIMTDQAWDIARNTPGVTGFLGSHGGGSKPIPLLPEEVEQIVQRMQAAESPTVTNIKIGDTVRIIADPFSGEVGKVTEIDQDKLSLKIEILGSHSIKTATVAFDRVDVIK